jgi:uncharacterized protein (DUF433 family)
MNENDGYKHLERRPGSKYKQLFIKDRKLPVRILYALTVGEDPQAAEEVAKDYELPLEAVQEAIDYCIHNENVLREDYERESAKLKDFFEKYPPLLPPEYVPEKRFQAGYAT